MWLLAVLGCTSGDDTDDTNVLPDIYTVACTLDPTPAIAGATTTVTLQVLDAAGDPVPDLQQTHERMLHTLLIPSDLSSFAHLHQEDFEDVTADDLRMSTFQFPYAFPKSGEFVLAFDFARENKYLRSADFVTIEGSPAVDAAPTPNPATEGDFEDLHAALVLDTAPSAGTETAFHLHLTRGGEPVDDVVQWLGTDAHIAIVSFDLESVGHTHAWIEGMDQLPPGHVMPHQYPGPDIPFRYVFPQSGQYRTWTQVATSAHPDPYLISFDVDVP
jgi:hypothetical protein